MYVMPLAKLGGSWYISDGVFRLGMRQGATMMKLMLIFLCMVIVQQGVVHASAPDKCGSKKCSDDQQCCSLTYDDTCEECCVNEHCANYPTTPYCHLPSQFCVECLVNDHCKPPTPVCVNELCNPGCTPGSLTCLTNQICDVTLGLCVCASDGQSCSGPNKACTSNGTCGCTTGYVLNNGICVPDCNPPCTAAQVCTINGDCICPAGTLPGTTPGVCEPFNSEMPVVTECTKNTDCPNVGEVCVIKQCVCPAGLKLFMGRCTAQGEIGGFCLNGKCKSRRAECNKMTNTCMCAGKCEPTTVCLKKRFYSTW